MMFTNLDAENYNHSRVFYKAEFETILSKVIACYKHMLIDNVSLSNNENSIRDYMLKNYLKKQWFKKQYDTTDFHFDMEVPENNGRVDIRILPVNPYINDDAYYIIECKRINANNIMGSSGLNSAYVQEGINRFVTSKYSTYKNISGMIGFVVQQMEIDKNIKAINKHLKTHQIKTNQELVKCFIASGFNFSYFSTHPLKNNEINIYHLMLDFSKNIY